MLYIPNYSEIDIAMRTDLIARLREVKDRIRDEEQTLANSLLDEIIYDLLPGLDDDPA